MFKKRIGLVWVFTWFLFLQIPIEYSILSARGQALPSAIKIHPLNPQNAGVSPFGYTGTNNLVVDTNLTHLAQWLRQKLTNPSSGTNATNKGQGQLIPNAASQAWGNDEDFRFRANGTPSLIRVAARQARPAAAVKPDQVVRDGKVRSFIRDHRTQMRIMNPDGQRQLFLSSATIIICQ